MKNLRRREKQFKLKPWITSTIKNSIKTKNKLYRLKLNSPRNVLIANNYNTYRNKLTHIKEHAKRLYYNKLIQQNMHNSLKIWKTINKIAYLTKQIQVTTRSQIKFLITMAYYNQTYI